jgi:hypothetical protein
MDLEVRDLNHSATLSYEKTATQLSNEATLLRGTPLARADECTYLRLYEYANQRSSGRVKEIRLYRTRPGSAMQLSILCQVGDPVSSN